MTAAHAGQRHRSLPRRVLSAFRRHPVRTLRRGEQLVVDRIERADDEAVERTGLGIGPLVVIVGFTVCVVGWVAMQLWRLR
ncbi:MAG: hypothetical protein J2P25_14475 [Nocardiopsaceae bacterium]|nr:hypothetical protein [Nocardiopsaceae bacterium]